MSTLSTVEKKIWVVKCSCFLRLKFLGHFMRKHFTASKLCKKSRIDHILVFLQSVTLLFESIILASVCKRTRGKLPYVANL